MQTAPLLTNNIIIDMLQRLFFSRDKPPRVKPVDISILTYLILRRCIDHEVFDSQDTIAKRLGSERRAVANSLERLEKLKWITVGGRGNGRTNALSVNLESLPAAEPINSAITPGAKFLAGRYMAALQRAGRKKFPKNWLQRQNPSAQRILTNCGGDLALARAMVSHALNSPRYKARASISLYHVLTVWPGVARSYQEKFGQQQQIAPTPPLQKGDSSNEQCDAAA